MTKIKSYINDLKSFNFNLFVSLCLLALIPAIYGTVRTFVLSKTIMASGFDVIGQMEWFDLLDETIKAFLIIPLYSLLNGFKKTNDFQKRVFQTGVITWLVYILFSICVFIYALHLITFMNPVSIDIQLVHRYLRIETIAFMVGILYSFINVVFIVVGKAKNIYLFAGLQFFLTIFSDFIIIPHLGVIGLAVSNIVINTILGIAGIIVLYIEKYIAFTSFSKQDISMIKRWGKIGSFSGMQQFIDNIIYALMIGKMVNVVAEQGNYWLANNFIWGWLLIPVSALSEIIRRDCKNGYHKIRQTNYYILTALFVLFWIITSPLWELFLSKVERLDNSAIIFAIVMKLLPFYIAYALSVIPDNIFIGLGKTKYNMINSAIINFIYYGVFFVLFRLKVLHITMNAIILMFGFGMVAHLVVSLIEEKIFLAKHALPHVKL